MKRFKFRKDLLFVLGGLFGFINIVILVYNRLKNDKAESISDIKAIWLAENGKLVVSMTGISGPEGGPSYDILTEGITNQHHFQYLSNPRHLCQNKPIRLVVGVASSAYNLDRRMVFRKLLVKDTGVVFVFFLGYYPGLLALQKRLKREAERYRDVVQEKFVDSYKNLTLKSMGILKWTSTFCPQAQYVVKQDDDVTLNIPAIMRAFYLNSMSRRHFILGDSKFLIESPIRDENSKYFTSKEQYPGEFFPMFAHGPGYGFPARTARLLYDVALRTRLFWLEDVFITGICASKAKIPVIFDPRFVTEHTSNE